MVTTALTPELKIRLLGEDEIDYIKVEQNDRYSIDIYINGMWQQAHAKIEDKDQLDMLITTLVDMRAKMRKRRAKK